MKARTLPSLLLISLVLLGSASTASAQAPIPNFKTTAPYKSLKNYVNMLRDRSATPATAEQKAQFRSKLAAKRNAANAKAKSLFTLTINRIKKKDDVQERRQVKRIRQNQKAQVAALNASLAAQLQNIDASERAALNRIDSRYDRRINPLARQRTALRRQLAMSRNPVQRIRIARKIESIQNELNALVQARQSAEAAIEARFDSRSDAAKERFSTRIKNAKASAKRQILQARRAWKNLFREEFADAKERRADNFDLVAQLREAGSGYIQAMPQPTE